jgi:hypothetical protein
LQRNAELLAVEKLALFSATIFSVSPISEKWLLPQTYN